MPPLPSQKKKPKQNKQEIWPKKAKYLAAAICNALWKGGVVAHQLGVTHQWGGQIWSLLGWWPAGGGIYEGSKGLVKPEPRSAPKQLRAFFKGSEVTYPCGFSVQRNCTNVYVCWWDAANHTHHYCQMVARRCPADAAVMGWPPQWPPTSINTCCVMGRD